MKTRLKIKIMSLAAEARIIRNEERKAAARARFLKERQGREADAASSADLRSSLHSHRVNAVRPESRASNLAYALLRGRRYDQVEQSCYSQPDWSRVASLLTTFGDYGLEEAKVVVTQWVEATVEVAA